MVWSNSMSLSLKLGTGEKENLKSQLPTAAAGFSCQRRPPGSQPATVIRFQPFEVPRPRSQNCWDVFIRFAGFTWKKNCSSLQNLSFSPCAANWAELREVYPTKWRICLLLHHVMKKSTFHSSIFPLAKVNDFNHWKYPFQLKTISEFNAMQNALEIFWAFRNLLNSSWCSHQWVASTTLRPDR